MSEKHAITILDGGFSRELTRQGAALKQPEWSAGALIDNTAAVTKAHAAFIAAGSDVITTNNYAIVPYHLGETRFASDAAMLLKRAGQLARDAANHADAAVRVAGSLPPACGSYIPDQFDADKARDILSLHRDVMTDYVDIWLAETMSSLEEARTTVEVVNSTDKPIWLSYSLQDDATLVSETPTLRSGEALSEALALAQSLQVDALLFNCSFPEVMDAAIKEARAWFADLPIGVYANAFIRKPRNAGANAEIAGVRDDLSPEYYAELTQRWVDSGATLIGGCCGVNAPHIEALAKRYKES